MFDTIEKILSVFTDTKASDWKPHANGGGFVQMTATVDLTARIELGALVYGSALVYGGRWLVSPPYIQGTRDSLTLSSPTEISVGCITHPIELWLDKYQQIGQANAYSPTEIEEYGEWLAVLAKRAQAIFLKETP